MPSFSACCRSDPTVRFIALAILSTGVFALECLRNSTCIAFVHATVFLFAFVATFLVTVFLAMHLSKIVRRSITHRSADASVTNAPALLACLYDWRCPRRICGRGEWGSVYRLHPQ